ncbi:hypothetical protein CERSUDRAFT_94339 [Gelatoporia subvermispora B]|uniref:PH domain-containing protein n=1 Tax=Ceriporiopsis subvermispora (strain B) TaxID=914234 RepID=M2QYV5_CERS8|nr:hypothetical protein CERSUDRAFT_94339 [Gelatoporia subvermispora B]
MSDCGDVSPDSAFMYTEASARTRTQRFNQPVRSMGIPVLSPSSASQDDDSQDDRSLSPSNLARDMGVPPQPVCTKDGRLAVATNSQGDDVDPWGPYFSLPRNTSGERPALTRRGTTKELIGRFESLTSCDSSKPSAHSTGRFHFRGGISTTSGNRDKKRSPLRQSIMNLLSVFGKKHKTSVKYLPEGSVLPTSTYHPDSVESDVVDRDIVIANATPPTQAGLGPSSSRYHVSLCNTPISPGSTLSGSLLYLSRPDRPDLLPVWTTCTAMLHTDHVLITWHTGHGNPETFIVPFTGCTDVRSLSMADLDESERMLLPSGTDMASLKVFELLFEGRPREKFAASSMRERAVWVSAIWNTVLQKQEPSSPRMHSVVVPFTPTSAMKSRVSLPATHDDRRSTLHDHSMAATPTERDLPPIPGSATSLLPVIRDTPTRSRAVSPRSVALSPLPIPPRTPTTPISIRASPCTPSGSVSPSIRNLGQLSVVKQRLAQMELTHSGDSPLAKGNTDWANSPTSSRRSAFARDPANGRLFRQDSGRSGVERSIIDSYAVSEVVSPLSMRSERPTSLASSCGSPTRTKNFWENEPKFRPPSKFLEVPKRDRSEPSPTSCALSDPESEKTAGLAPDADMDVKPITFPNTVRLTDSTHSESVTVQEQGRAAECVATRPVLSITTSISECNQADVEKRQPRVTSGTSSCAGRKTDIQTSCSSRSAKPVEHSPRPDIVKALESVHHSVEGLKELAGADDVKLNGICSRVDAIFNEVKLQSIAQGADASASLSITIARVLKELEAMRSDLRSNFPRLVAMLEGLRSTCQNAGVVGLQDVKSSSFSDQPAQADWLALHAKLDGLMTACQSLQITRDQATVGDSMAETDRSRETQEILDALQAIQMQWSAQTEQQTDSVRYLNELNSWLEAFVNHGTSQIEGVAAGVQQLCQELGTALTPGGEVQYAGILSEIRVFLAESRAREDNSASLQASVNGLIAAVQEDLRRNAEARNMLTTESIAGLIDRQRYDHERMLKTLASELSNDIRGERLRFVEAMKEATAINVQIHVEEFKKELTREVLLMTHEVGRLQRERQGLEQQIADLFAFYAKQKQADGSKVKFDQSVRFDEEPPVAQILQPTQPQFRGRRGNEDRPQLHIVTPAAGSSIPTMRRRPLPTPSPSPSRAPSLLR